jgi:methylthioribose-1-phosphate isomerase
MIPQSEDSRSGGTPRGEDSEVARTGRKQRLIIPTIDFVEGRVRIIDQTLLPEREEIVDVTSLEAMAEAIRKLKIRGAPAIGIAGAYGILLAIEGYLGGRGRGASYFDREKGFTGGDVPDADVAGLKKVIADAAEILLKTRPTAVNLPWAIERVKGAADGSDVREVCGSVADAAFGIHAEELEIEEAIGDRGAAFVEDGMKILTHCNAGGLATAGFGTALAVLYRAFEAGRRFRVYADETRPLLQGSRLTAWELMKRGIDVTVICDSAAASLFAAGEVDMVVVGADRIAANGDVANKVGTLGLAILCEKYERPFYVAAPWSSFDTEIATGAAIPIEERSPEEVTSFAGVTISPPGARAYNPAFDVTPAGLITAIITESGVIENPDAVRIEALARNSKR